MSMICVFLLAITTASNSSDPHKPDVDRAWTILKAGVSESHADKRAKAVRALGLAPDNQEIRLMAEKALTDSNTDVRAEAATALGQMHATAAIPKLKEALKDRELAVVLASTNALYTMKDPTAYEVYYAIVTGKRKSGAGLLQSQLDMLHNRKQVEKLAFETGIGFVPFGSVAYDAWKTIMRGDSGAVVAQAVERLSTDPDPKSQKAVEDACYDAKWQVRAAAVTALAKRGDPSSLDYVVSAMQDDSDVVEYEAAASVIYLTGRAEVHSHPGSRRQTSPRPSLK
jgi:HEAT repeat protein